MKSLYYLCIILLFFPFQDISAQKKRKKKEETTVQQEAQFDASHFKTMKWRNIGPFRGGRSTTVCGVIQDQRTYYMGTTGGGVWKTTNAGHTWLNISDGFFNTGSIGAVAVAPSDPNVVYAGTGESPIRGVMTSSGDGIYKSTDAGKTWQHLGLEDSRQISAVRIHPDNADLVWVAVQGSPYVPGKERGIYHSEDGGVNWKHVLFVDENSGASDLSLDISNPRVLYAAFWDHQRLPWKIRSGGEGSSIWKSTDGGKTWKKLEQGLPKTLMGKIGISVSPASSNRVYAIIESDEGGLYRSDDAGENWKRINPDRVLRARSWYYMHIFTDPSDANIVYVLNAPMMRSADGGKTFKRVMTPHGDNHALWINPENPGNMINGNDGGANISFDGGNTWSTQQNQPTAQFYRVNADNQFPYHVYGGQQDNSTVAIPSATQFRGIRNDDFYRVGGCESAFCAFDPDNPRYVYAGCYQGIISEYDTKLKAGKDIMTYPDLGLGQKPADMKYRFNWNAPILVSKHDPNIIYHAANVLFKSADRGMSWEAISPDLTKDIDENQEWGGGPITNEGAGGENYHTIMYVSESTKDPNEIWAGTDDGRIHLTRDGGDHWTDITPHAMQEGIVNSIDLDSNTPGKAYAAVTRYKFDDFSPYVYITQDYGESWSLRSHGIDENAHVRVVRADPKRKGLLFAGTERGIYISFDDGQQWLPFQLNLPIVPVTDLMIHRGDLIAATQGRAFWILDDLTPIREFGKNDEIQFFTPQQVVMWGGPRIDTLRDMGTNPDYGMLGYFFLPEGKDSLGCIAKIKDEKGRVIRTFSTKADIKEDKIKLKPGLNKINWNLRRSSYKTPKGLLAFGGKNGPRISPGLYSLEIITEGDSAKHEFKVYDDPRGNRRDEFFIEKQNLLEQLYLTTEELYESVRSLQHVRSQIQTFQKRPDLKDSVVINTGKDLIKEIDSLESQLVQVKQKTFQDVINYPNQLNAKLMHIQNLIDSAYPPVTQGQKQRVDDLMEDWHSKRNAVHQLMNEKLKAYNAMIQTSQLPFISPELPDQKKKSRT